MRCRDGLCDLKKEKRKNVFRTLALMNRGSGKKESMAKENKKELRGGADRRHRVSSDRFRTGQKGLGGEQVCRWSLNFYQGE